MGMTAPSLQNNAAEKAVWGREIRIAANTVRGNARGLDNIVWGNSALPIQ
jgi:hypothetical protein